MVRPTMARLPIVSTATMIIILTPAPLTDTTGPRGSPTESLSAPVHGSRVTTAAHSTGVAMIIADMVTEGTGVVEISAAEVLKVEASKAADIAAVTFKVEASKVAVLAAETSVVEAFKAEAFTAVEGSKAEASTVAEGSKVEALMVVAASMAEAEEDSMVAGRLPRWGAQVRSKFQRAPLLGQDKQSESASRATEHFTRPAALLPAVSFPPGAAVLLRK